MSSKTISGNTSSESGAWSHAALNILYNLTSVINAARTRQELLTDFLDFFILRFNLDAGLIRLLTDDGWMEIAASSRIEKKRINANRKTPIDGSIFSHSDDTIDVSTESFLQDLCDVEERKALAVPIRYLVRTLGVMNLYIDSDIQLNEEQCRVLLIAGQHLGLALDRFNDESEMMQHLVQQERSMIANELHDSLAQTLASLRFQVRILDETLQPSSDFSSIDRIEQVEQGLDEAYTDLRELIAHCRVPIDKQGLIPSITRAVEKFREETNINILLQCECKNPQLPPNMEMNAYRIVQEALTNVKKHARAHIVRVLLKCNEQGEYLVLVENDGRGFNQYAIQSAAGKHLGLTIMKERARHLGGDLKIDTEPDEGTRVELRFTYKNENA